MIGSLSTVPSVSRAPPGLQLTNGTGTTTSSRASPTNSSAETNAVQVWRVTGAGPDLAPAGSGSSASGSPTQAVVPEAKRCSFQIGTSALSVSIRCAQAARAGPRCTAPTATTTARSPTSR